MTIEAANLPLYKGKVFLYPCAGLGIPDALSAFWQQFDTFLFVDTKYRLRHLAMPPCPGWAAVPGTRRLEGKPEDTMRCLQSSGRRYREIEPAWLREDFKHLQSGRVVEVCLRRGFGQYALHEVTDGTLGMFMHRGDSGGEGGSGVCYLANQRMSHPPISDLFDVIKRKLTMPGLIASDGSNSAIRELNSAASEGNDIESFVSHGLLWQKKMIIHRSRSSRLTVVWSVTSSDCALRP